MLACRWHGLISLYQSSPGSPCVGTACPLSHCLAYPSSWGGVIAYTLGIYGLGFFGGGIQSWPTLPYGCLHPSILPLRCADMVLRCYSPWPTTEPPPPNHPASSFQRYIMHAVLKDVPLRQLSVRMARSCTVCAGNGDICEIRTCMALQDGSTWLCLLTGVVACMPYTCRA